ncbi:TetR/AcrR family transcriptional regulator [Halobacillus sp. Marseille-P3879]|uniref:TetR/AcrR family transcriptional regulator n=1 Tax=Halobacillus sp. Marseille-P3879 TaxID=2045014 RepID=UPI000C7C2670|nr:TetR/AcrR family transcriptional regulator [Halobacillus sp. Marseille-P3879]
MKKNKDPRVQRSTIWIKEAFLTLLKEHHLDHVSVQQIMNQAQMNRATFYRHFVDKEDLLTTIVEDLLVRWKTLIDDCPRTFDFVKEKKPHPRFVGMLQFIYVERLTFETLLSKQELGEFQKQFEQFIQSSTRSTLEIAFDYLHSVKFSPEITLTFIASSISGTIKWWVENDYPCTAYDLASYITEMIDYGIYTK